MDITRYLVEAHLREGRPVAELAARHGVHRSWIYKLLARYRAEGEAGLELALAASAALADQDLRTHDRLEHNPRRLLLLVRSATRHRPSGWSTGEKGTCSALGRVSPSPA